MARAFESITPPLAAALEAAPMFFVASAPLDAGGHVNVSPKGGDTFRLIDEHTVCYLDLTGSGAETVAHLRENGRLTLMVCAFEGGPQIVRLYGRGEVLVDGDDGFDELAARFPPYLGARAVVRLHVDRVSASCGYGVPLMRYEGERTKLEEWAAKLGPDGLADYRSRKNTTSIDGLPAMGALTRS